MIRRYAFLAGLACAAALLAGAGGAPGALTDVADQAGRRVFPALRASDILAEAGQETTLEAGIGTGLKQEGLQDQRIQFTLGETLLGEVRTDAAGKAALKWKVPEKPADYRIRARLHPDDPMAEPVGEVEIFVAARDKDTKIVITDLDRTVVASGFFSVLAGMAKPMPGAAIVLGRLAKDHTVVYLTHRPDYFGPKSKAWLWSHDYPRGPVLLSDVRAFIKGSAAYKTAAIEQLRKRFTRIEIGIGDKVSDAAAYHANGLKAFLIVQVGAAASAAALRAQAKSLDELPDGVQVVKGWDEIEKAVFRSAVFPRQRVQQELAQQAAERERKANETQTGKKS